ncbi:uncharacterized protein LOC127278124 [Leptopilina boulardi]|uniref:uncharacterized protein LOC127278124 n=1 Tax=Leptopilina boulardi TaxID=63433 RepID=UPI0021F585F0|nr:uncharacterized protein LOC127278124 [Leptopilina boulardi]
METTNFMTPMNVVQTISMFSYLSTLSDFLLGKNLLNVTNQFQPIPVINGLYHYLNDNNGENQTIIIEQRKIQLARKLIEGSDLYGAKENEIPDAIFVDSLYKHIITTLVFEKYTNIYGFLVEIVRNSKNTEIKTIHDNILTTLTEETFLNENGKYSKLERLSIFEILKDFIHPLFLKVTSKNINLLSIDYIYAQAGLMFHLSGINLPLLKATEFNENEEINSTIQFNKYIILAHAVEQLVISKKLDKKVLRIFTLPALFYYTYNKKELLKNVNIGNIMNNSTTTIKAFNMLFTHINQTFVNLENAKKNDYRYQFYLARSNFKNRTTLAREIIRSNCSTVKKEDLEHEVLKYENNPDNYQCNTAAMKWKKLKNLNRLYQEEINNITKKYLVYEKESIREAFGSDFIKSIDANKVIISKGLLTYVVDIRAAREFQWVKESDDLFRFEFIKNETSLYFAILRENNEIMVMQENGATSNCSTTPKNNVLHCNPAVFREKLEMSRHQDFRNNYFPQVKKQKDESFEKFLNQIAEEKANKFMQSITRLGYDQTRMEWWKDFGLSLLPFYTCYHGIKTENPEEENACLYDAIALFPLVGDLEFLLEKFITVTTRSLFSAAGTTFASLTLRTSWRTTLSEISTILSNEAIIFSESFTKETFKNLGLSLIRSIDPGFELIYDIGQEGLRSMRNLINELGKYSSSIESLNSMLLKYEETISNTFTKVSNKFSDKDVYVNSLSNKNSAYGYKYIQFSDNQVVQIRQIEEYENREMPVVLFPDKKNLYWVSDIEKGKIGENVLHVKNEHIQNKNPEFQILSFHDTRLCGSVRLRRSPTTCIRTVLQKNREEVEREAMDFVRNHEEFSNVDVGAQLKKFVFPGNGEKQLEFVRDWRELIKEGKKNVPEWSKEYEIDNPNLFERLMYSDKMDEIVISAEEANSRINSVVSQDALMFLPPNILKNYISKRAFESLTLEDFAAITNFQTIGYTRIQSNTIEAKSMRAALYRLAIRQMENSVEEFSSILYRGEIRPQDVVDKLFRSDNKELKLTRFTSASTSKEIALGFQKSNADGVNILYEIKFSGPYPGAKLNMMGSFNHEMETVLLPNSKFNIDEVLPQRINNKEVLLVKLSFSHDIPKHTQYKIIMNELKELNKRDATFMEKIWSSFCCSSQIFLNIVT